MLKNKRCSWKTSSRQKRGGANADSEQQRMCMPTFSAISKLAILGKLMKPAHGTRLWSRQCWHVWGFRQLPLFCSSELTAVQLIAVKSQRRSAYQNAAAVCCRKAKRLKTLLRIMSLRSLGGHKFSSSNLIRTLVSTRLVFPIDCQQDCEPWHHKETTQKHRKLMPCTCFVNLTGLHERPRCSCKCELLYSYCEYWCLEFQAL